MEESNDIARQLLHSLMQFRSHFRPKAYKGLKPSEYKLLFTIKSAKKHHGVDLTVSSLSKYLQVTAPSVTQLINRLETDGLVERRMDTNDRRSVKVMLTEEGEKVTKMVIQAYLERLQGFIDFFGEEKSRQLADSLSEMMEYFAQNDFSSNWDEWR
ncbi:MarR family transcriptional regulator [Bacillus sp. FJAT-49736]|uniref:MarR family winged helix-turn-helix transcriptional regulator n=1 Tax=Bacillus sp. FJAT-49736 TaxID=2833582 RepID=UPI001BC9B0A7|nr:MarR family transcriptional regulator [Bacillus sp. FJAT-49736]